jgi:uncharacterized protein
MASTDHAVAPSRPTALVTGASGGIGRDLAKLLAAGGHDLILVARSVDALDLLAAELRREHGVAAAVVGADLSEADAGARVAAEVEARGLRVDVLVNNAGVGLYGAYLETDGERELRMIQLNVMALTQLTKLLLPAMAARRSGRIMNVASVAAFQPGPYMAVYYATKAYVLSYSEALAEELSGSGVTVTCLCPGVTSTNFQATAELKRSRRGQRSITMDSATVARAGYDGLMRGKRIVIPGALNKALVQGLRLTPRRLVTRIVRTIQRSAAPTTPAP